MKHITQITKVFERYSDQKVLFETKKDVPVDKIESGTYIQLNHEYKVSISIQSTILTEIKKIYSYRFTSSVGDTSIQIDLGTIFRHSENADVASVRIQTFNYDFDQDTLDDIKTLKELFIPVLMQQKSNEEFSTLYAQERELADNIEAEKEKILKKEAREKARAIASAQLQKERQTVRKETPRK